MVVNFRHEEITGASLSGSSGAANRTYTLANSNAVQPNFQLVVSGQILQSTVNYTLASDIITFLNPTFDAQTITIDYITSAVSLPDTVYCEANDVEDQLMKARGTFTTTSKPTLAQVNTLIINMSDKIDKDTRHAWREVTITNKFYSIRPRATYFHGAGVKVPMKHRDVRDWDTAEGDKIEIWDGTQYVDWLTDNTEGRASDFWTDFKGGNLYIKRRRWIFFEKPIRLTFRYGEATVPQDITDACAMMVASKILRNEDNAFVLAETESGQNMVYDTRAQKMKVEIKEILANRRELFFV